MRRAITFILLFLVAVCGFLYLQNKKNFVVLTSDLNKQKEFVRKYQDQIKVPPDNFAITQLEKENLSKEQQLRKSTAVFDSKENELPEDISDKGIYFFESLQAVMKLLERKAASKKIIIPQVDFAIDIPKEEDLPYLLKQVEIIRDAAGIIIDNGKCDIELIRPFPLENTKLFNFDKLSIQFLLNIDSEYFLKVLFQLNSHIPAYLIEDISIISIDQKRLKINFIISRVITNTSLEDIVELKNKGVVDLNSLYPLDTDIKSFSKRNPFFRFNQSAQNISTSQTAQKGSSAPQFTYKGSIYMKQKLAAIIKDNWQDKVYFSSIGDACSGYKIKNISEDKLILSKDEQEIILLKGQ